MTDLSKNSRGRNADTVSNTGNRSYQGKVNTFSKHSSQSESRYSQEPLTNQYEVSYQFIMPLVSAIKQENEHLRSQKQYAQGDMKILQGLLRYLLEENQQLRSHYSQRTKDIKSLIQTITINTNEEISDIDHQCHLFREANISLVKEIETKVKKQNEIEQEILQKREELDVIGNSCMEEENKLIDVRVKNKQLERDCVDQQSQQTDTSSLQKEVNDLLVELTQIRNKNTKNIHETKRIQEYNQENRINLQQGQQKLIKHNQEMSREVQKMLESKQKIQSQNEQAKQKNSSIYDKLIEGAKKYENLKYKVQKSQKEIQNILEQRKEREKGIKISQEKLVSVNKEKGKIMKAIEEKKSKIEGMKEERSKLTQKIKNGHLSKLEDIRKQISLSTSTANEELVIRLNPQSQEMAEAIEKKKEQFAILVQEISELKENVGKLQNPVKQIIRMQYELQRSRR